MFNNKASWTWNIYLQHPRPHNKSTTIPSIRNVRVPNVISVISKHDKSDDETMNAPYLSHWTISIVTTALRRLLHLYCLPFRPCSGHTRSKSEQNGRHTQSETVLGASRASKIPCRLDSSGISPFIRYIYYFLHCFFLLLLWCGLLLFDVSVLNQILLYAESVWRCRFVDRMRISKCTKAGMYIVFVTTLSTSIYQDLRIEPLFSV